LFGLSNTALTATVPVDGSIWLLMNSIRPAPG
jgi:hypothetical protein